MRNPLTFLRRFFKKKNKEPLYDAYGDLINTIEEAWEDNMVVLRAERAALIAKLADTVMEHFGALPGDWDQIVNKAIKESTNV